MVDFLRLGSCVSLPRRQISIESTLAPDKFLDKLRAETVNYEEIFQVSTPLAGYATFLQHSFRNLKRVVATIEGLSFMLFPIGIVPAKGKSPLANAGALHGTVEPSKTGSRIDTHYRFGAGLLLFVAAFGLVSVSLVAIAALATITNPQQAGLLQLQGLAVASCVFTATFAVYFWIARRSQSQLLKAFLDDVCSATSVKRMADGVDNK